MSIKSIQQRGSAMFIAILLVVVGFATLMAISELAGNNFKRTDDYMAREQSFYAAVGGVDYVYSDIWGSFEKKRSDLGDDLYSFRDFLASFPFQTSTGTAVLAHQGVVNVGTKYTVPASYLEVTKYNGFRIGASEISRVRLSRNDYPDPKGSDSILFTELRIEVEAKSDSDEYVWASRAVKLANVTPFQGTYFAVLTKNITCSLCHMRVQNIAKVNGLGNAESYGETPKIRVGTTELLAMRPSSAETVIEGALYHRGRIEEEFSGNPIDYSTVVGSTVKTVSQDISDGTVRQNPTNGAVTITNLSSTGVVDNASYRTSNGIDEDGDSTIDEGDESVFAAPKGQRRVDAGLGVPNKNDSLYLEYPKTEKEMKASDGILPIDSIVDQFDPSKDNKAFPEPFKDLNKNRVIDADEIAQQVNAAKNKAKNGPGSLVAGIGVRLEPNEAYGSATMPTGPGTVKVGGKAAGYDSYTDRTVSGVSVTQSGTGTYILTGTESNPIRVDGKVVIEGDVMIQGYIKGEGQIYATGNVYVPNDVKYLNRKEGGNEVFGENDVQNPITGQYGRNLFGVTAGGSIVVGDYIGTVTHWNSNNSKFYDYGMPEPGRKLNRSLISKLPDTGLNHVGSDSKTSATSNYVNFANFVMEELSFFNQSELVRVSKKNKTASNTNNPTNWAKDNTYNPSSNPAGQWRVIPGETSTTYVPRFYRMYGELPEPGATATPTLDYGKSYSAVAGEHQSIPQSGLKDSPIPFYLNRNMNWDNTKGFYANTGDPHTYNSIAEIKLTRNISTGLWDYDQNFFDNGDTINPTPASANTDNRIPREVLDTTAISKAKILNIHPSWITPTNMMNLLLTEERRRNDGNNSNVIPRQFDGLMYTNNAIFMIERKQTQKHSGTYDPATGKWSGGSWSKVPTESNGSFVVNGAIIAPDLGILVTGGTQTSSTAKKGFTPTMRGGTLRHERQAFVVNYDVRVRDLLEDLGAQLKWTSYRKGWARSMGKMP